MLKSQFAKLQTGDHVRWDGGNDAIDPPCDGTVKRHEREEGDVIEINWEDDELSMLIPIRSHLTQGLLSHLRLLDSKS